MKLCLELLTDFSPALANDAALALARASKWVPDRHCCLGGGRDCRGVPLLFFYKQLLEDLLPQGIEVSCARNHGIAFSRCEIW